MTIGRDSSFMIRNTSFTKQVHFYICKIQIIKPKLYLLSRNRSTVHHYYHIVDTASVAPAHTKSNLFPMVSFKQTAELQFKVKFAENCSRFNLPVNAKELLFILWTGQTKFWKAAKVETVPIIFVWQTSLPVILLRTQCASINGWQVACKMYSLICMLGYIKTNIVIYISNPFRCTTFVTLLDRDPVQLGMQNLRLIALLVLEIWRHKTSLGRRGTSHQIRLFTPGKRV